MRKTSLMVATASIDFLIKAKTRHSTHAPIFPCDVVKIQQTTSNYYFYCVSKPGAQLSLLLEIGVHYPKNKQHTRLPYYSCHNHSKSLQIEVCYCFCFSSRVRCSQGFDPTKKNITSDLFRGPHGTETNDPLQ